MGTKLYMKTDDSKLIEVGETGAGVPELEEISLHRRMSKRRTAMLLILYILLFLNLWGSILFGYFYPGVFLTAMLTVGGILVLRLYRHGKEEVKMRAELEKIIDTFKKTIDDVAEGKITLTEAGLMTLYVRYKLEREFSKRDMEYFEEKIEEYFNTKTL